MRAGLGKSRGKAWLPRWAWYFGSSLVDFIAGHGGEQDASYDLDYPDGAHDAEALVTHPLTGQVSVITKGAFAGSVMQAPLELSQAEANTLTEVGRTPGIVTDAEFLPGGGAVLVRTYSRAVVLEYPSWRLRSSVRRLCTMLPLPTIKTPLCRNCCNCCPNWKCSIGARL